MPADMAGEKAKVIDVSAHARLRAEVRAASKRPKHLAHGHWLGDFPDLTDAEQALILACSRGEWCHLGTEVPETATSANRVRAGLIRFLLLGGGDENPVHEAGVMIAGGWIDGDLDLDMVHANGRFALYVCRLSHFLAQDARFPALSLRGTHLDTIVADRIEVRGTVFLDEGFTATGTVTLSGARFGDDLECSGGIFGDESKAPASALTFEGAIIGGNANLCDDFQANGEVRLVAAEIGGSLYCHKGSFRGTSKSGAENRDALSLDKALIKRDVYLSGGFKAVGEVRMLGAQIGGSLTCSEGQFDNQGGSALVGDTLKVGGGLFLRDANFKGGINLSVAHVGSLVDDLTCWPADRIILDGFQYDRLTGCPTEASERIAWLKNQIPSHLGEKFKPQPWEQLVKVLREMGHPEAAKRVAMEKQRVWRRSCKHRWRKPGWWVHKLYGIFAGYGYRPWWTAGWMLAVCLACTAFYYDGRNAGLFGPTDSQIQTQAELRKVCGPIASGRTPWTSSQCPMPREYPSFQPFLYSLDVILPLIDLHQEPNWGPIRTNDAGKPIHGWWLRWVVWFEILFGWAGSALLAAVAGNLVKKD